MHARGLGCDDGGTIYDDAIANIVRSIALEEEAVSRLIHSMADQAVAFAGRGLNFPTNPSSADIVAYNQTLLSFFDVVLMSKRLRLTKLKRILSVQPTVVRARTESLDG
jgi:hypothetical protein